MHSRTQAPLAVRWRVLAASSVAVIGVTATITGFQRLGSSESGAQAAVRAESTASAGSSAPNDPPRAAHDADPRVALGKAIFFDASLSDPAGTSCASCHDPAHAFAGNHGSNSGVALGSRPGHFAKRNTPSVLYLKFVPRFHFHWEEDVDLPDGSGGFFWDGRSDSLSALVEQPLFNPDEMNAGDPAEVATKLAAAPYASAFRRVFGAALDDPSSAKAALSEAIGAFLTSDAMTPFTSKYDDFIRGRIELAPLEARGMRVFKDATKGACDGCHRMNEASPMPERSLFTDYGFEAVGAPRNRKLAANRDPARFDLGLCERHDHPHMEEERFCGTFRTPSLRNVATRTSFMHNGAFTSLRDVVAFYATRGTDPKRWYGPSGTFDDLPAKYRENVDATKAPYDRGLGERPRMDGGEIDAVVAFLQTLTDAEVR